MNFTVVYVAFIVTSTIYRILQLGKSYKFEPKPGKVYAKTSYSILLALYLIIIVGSILEYFYCRYIICLRPEVNLLISGIGFLMYAGVIPLRARAVESLGRYISPDIKIVEDHKLICAGPYRYIRHPLALYVMIEVIGFTLIPNSYFSLIAALIIFCPFMLYRIHLEEKALIEKFGQEYLDYKKQVYALLPLKRVKQQGEEQDEIPGSDN